MLSTAANTSSPLKMQTTVDGVSSPPATSPSPGSDVMRGRTRDRNSHQRSPAVKPTRTDQGESSTLRGRSRQRASSPSDLSSKTPSSSLLSPTRHLLIYNRLRDSRREHCPSRAPSPPNAGLRRRRTRSRDRGPRLECESRETPEVRSSLRNEVHINEEDASPAAESKD